MNFSHNSARPYYDRNLVSAKKDNIVQTPLAEARVGTSLYRLVTPIVYSLMDPQGTQKLK